MPAKTKKNLSRRVVTTTDTLVEFDKVVSIIGRNERGLNALNRFVKSMTDWKLSHLNAAGRRDLTKMLGEIRKSLGDAKRGVFGSHKPEQCLYCGSVRLKRLDSCHGDPEGLRHDRQCLTCGGFFGCTKAMAVRLGPEDFTEDGYHPPDPVKVLAMKVLKQLDEKFQCNFTGNDANEELSVNEVAPLIAHTWAALLADRDRLKDIIGRVQSAVL